MADMTPRVPERPLRWPDVIFDLQEHLADARQQVYLVGGCVRDALLGRPLHDIDLVVSESGIRLARQVADRMGGAFYPLDAERDVGRALIDTPDGRLIVDAARFRGADLEADLTDRDFTVNAMAVDLRGALDLLIDPLGGEKDLIDRLLRRCNPQAITRDPIRALRAVRQSVQFNLRIEEQTKQDIRQHAARLADVSPERVRDEFVSLLASRSPASGLRVAGALGLVEVVIPEAQPRAAPDRWARTLAVVEHLARILMTISPLRTDETAAQFSLGMIVMALDRFRRQLQAHIGHTWPDERPHSALLMLAALLRDAGEGQAEPAAAAARIAERRAYALRLSSAERQRLAAIVRAQGLPLSLPDRSPRSIYRFWRSAGEAGVDACLLALAGYLAAMGQNIQQDAWIAALEQVQALLAAYYEQRERLVDPPPLVDGTMLMQALGLKRGRVIGHLLELIREAQASGDVQTADDALALARRYLADESAGRDFA